MLHCTLGKPYYRGARGRLLVYDVTNKLKLCHCKLQSFLYNVAVLLEDEVANGIDNC
ncbi:hypothetical protein ERO13_A11G034250v2 [Gossypium hirsutum]|nr:hypothetical protein ERO13_A11G034250v2 [Gossypium hirsutum]